MTGSDRVRHCERCDHRVYDLSELTRADAEALIVANEGRMCVRFYERADGTLVLRDCEVPRPGVAASIARGAALVALAGAVGCGAQPHHASPPAAQHAPPAARLESSVIAVVPEPPRMGVMAMDYGERTMPEPQLHEPPSDNLPAPLTHALDQYLEPKR